MYENIALNCFRYLGYKSFDDVDRLNLREYRVLMKAVNLKTVDRMFDIHLSAFKNFEVRARKKSGRPVYRNFDKFYNYRREVDRVMSGNKAEENDKFADLRRFVSQQAKKKEGN